MQLSTPPFPILSSYLNINYPQIDDDLLTYWTKCCVDSIGLENRQKKADEI